MGPTEGMAGLHPQPKAFAEPKETTEAQIGAFQPVAWRYWEIVETTCSSKDGELTEGNAGKATETAHLSLKRHASRAAEALEVADLQPVQDSHPTASNSTCQRHSWGIPCS